MFTTLKIVQFISLVLLLLVTGVFWGTWFSLSRSIKNITSATFLENGKIIIKNLAFPMGFMMPLTVLFMLAGLWLYPTGKIGFYLNGISIILIIVTLLITVFIEVPIDNQIKRWTVTTLPVGWKVLRSKWQLYHTVRTFTSLASFVLLLLSILFY